MRPGEFELDMAGIARVLNDTQAVDALERRTARVVAEARATGPRGEHAGVHEIDTIAVGETHHTDDGAVVDIDWPSHVWHIITFGSIHNPPYHPIERSAQNNGLKVIDARGGGR